MAANIIKRTIRHYIPLHGSTQHYLKSCQRDEPEYNSTTDLQKNRRQRNKL